MSRLWEMLVYGSPWWLQAAGGGLLAVPVLVLVARLFGLRQAGAVALGFGAVLAAFAHGRQARQQGWAERDAKGKRDAHAAIDLARVTRARSGERDGGERLHDDDGWRRD